MTALRQRAALLARQVRPTAARPAAMAAVRFGSTESHSAHGDHHDHHDHHDHGHGHAEVNEPLGFGFFAFIGVMPCTYIVYNISRPGPNGEPSSLHAYFSKFTELTETWEQRNTMRTAIYEQAARDKNLFYNAERAQYVEHRYPESFMAGSPFNIPAGQSMNMEKVIEHYRAEHHKEVARQQSAAAAKAAKAASAE